MAQIQVASLNSTFYKSLLTCEEGEFNSMNVVVTEWLMIIFNSRWRINIFLKNLIILKLFSYSYLTKLEKKVLEKRGNM